MGDFVPRVTRRQRGQLSKPAARHSRLPTGGQHLASVQGTRAHLPPEGAFEPPSLRGTGSTFVVFQVWALGLEKLPTTGGRLLSEGWVPNKAAVVFNLDARKSFLQDRSIFQYQKCSCDGHKNHDCLAINE